MRAYVIKWQPLNGEDYIAVGLAKCFKLNEGGKLDGARLFIIVTHAPTPQLKN